MTDHELDAWIHNHVRGVTDKTYAVPEYTADRNDCAVAEVEIAGIVNVSEYVYALREVVALVLPEEEMMPDSTFTYHLLTATARQRCDAIYAIREEIEKARAA